MDNIRKFLAIFGALAGFMGMGLSFGLINANLESIHVALGASTLQLQWIINLYGIFIASNLVAMGRVGDLYGRKRVFLLGMGLFAIAMLGGGLASTPEVIIGFQTLWGLAGAILLPLSQAILIDIFPEEKKNIATGIWNSAGGISLAVGPLIGGMILEFFSWRWIFLINLPFIFVGFLLTYLCCRESRTKEVSKKIDWAGAFILKLGIATFVLATIQSNEWKWSTTLFLYGLSLVSFLWLRQIEKNAETPILRTDLLKNRNFLLYCLGGFCMIGIFWSEIFLLPFFIQKELHYPPFHTGLILLGFATPIALFSPITGYLYQKVPVKLLIGAGFFLLMISGILQTQFSPNSTIYFLIFTITLLGTGFSLISTPTLAGALSTISKDSTGVASGTFVTMQEIGGSVGLALTATIVRKQLDFSDGFHNGIWIILVIGLIGLFSTFLLENPIARIEKN